MKKMSIISMVIACLLLFALPGWADKFTFVEIENTKPTLLYTDTSTAAPAWRAWTDQVFGHSYSVMWFNKTPIGPQQGCPFLIEYLTGDYLLYLDANDRIGINTATPGYTVDVIGDRIRLRNDTSSTARTLMMRTDGAAVDLQSLNANLFINSGDNNIIMNPWGAGVVGIGTSIPPAGARLTVVKEGAVEATVFPNFSAMFFNTGSAYFGFRNTTDNVEGLFGVGGGAGARFGLGSITDTPIEFLINWEDRATTNPVVMLLNTNGSLQMRSGASCTAGGVWTNASSREYKKDIKELTGNKAIDALKELNPVEFTYKKDLTEERHVGFIAEDVPDLVATKDRKGMSPMDVVAVLTKVLQTQQKINEDQKKTISEMSKRLAELEKRVALERSPTL